MPPYSVTEFVHWLNRNHFALKALDNSVREVPVIGSKIENNRIYTDQLG